MLTTGLYRERKLQFFVNDEGIVGNFLLLVQALFISGACQIKLKSKFDSMFLDTKLEHDILVCPWPFNGFIIELDSDLFNLPEQEIGAVLLRSKANIGYAYEADRIKDFIEKEAGNLDLLKRDGSQEIFNSQISALKKAEKNPFLSHEIKAKCRKALLKYYEIRREIALRRMPSKYLKDRIRKRDQSRCRYCGIDTTGRIHFDHIFPWIRGGKTTYRNLVVSCSGCNLRKHDKTLEEADMRLLKSSQQ